MFLSWITRLVKAAVLQGFREAAEELDLRADDGPDVLESLKNRMTALPAPSLNGKRGEKTAAK